MPQRKDMTMSEALVKRLKEQRANIWEQGKALLDTIEAEGRDFTAEENTTWAAMNTDLSSLDERVHGIEDVLKRNGEADEAFNRLGATREQPVADKAEADVRAFLRGEGARTFDLAADTKFRDLVKGTTTAGGHTVPTTFYGQLVEHMTEMSAVLSAGPTVLQTQSGENIDVPITTAHGAGALVAEAGAIAESDPTFGKRTLGAYKYGVLIQVARELVDDTGVDLTGYLARQAGWGVGNALGTDLVVGNASSKPSGIVQTASTGVTGATSVAGVFTADNLIDLYHSVIGPYRKSPSCAWIMRDATLATVRKLKDTTNQYLWQPSLVVGAPDTLLGKPLYTDPNVAATATSAKSVIFGDISRYFVRLAGGVRFERSDEYAFGNDLVTFRCLVRGDGILADQTGAVKVFVGGAS